MKAKEITVGYTFTKNLGNYQSVKVDASVTMAVDEGESPEVVAATGYKYCREQVKKGISEFGNGV
ncbi:hypothetical protein M5X00_16605 [Paenibacillus alvei]|uniref:Uncharacterized protein n=1 Tax=Paenibacillus alvei TaxID=44250 RepID=A0ABT4GVU7_PAEAL|nr:hypothetical protein [Paenibacillus alvei]EJW17580.1 hypothetical protein PAV_3c00250 [Paenibacillus alvei DSM 29]MCY9544525.1 hypothetical protein [Paenibacillus alvei]MCY9706956.1 hypothetical protein [Paenibacillus alvei]MCY9736074.1 hypothetical protein [Paenibacillus alvei]MCY9755862.1 hypothetical protein [Paenibacillus alvei]